MAHYNFEPNIYHSTIGSHEPVLNISDGDSVSTTTVDAGGNDSTNKSITPRGNPQTGPFYIKGAKPGDTLAVTLDKIGPNRKIGFTSSRIAPNVLDPGYDPKFQDNRSRIQWEINMENNTASPIDLNGPLSNLCLPLCAMIGCFGVAPPRGQAISTSTSSTHGGNMDYNGFIQGTVCYFPVFVDGALFHIGDGHAVQGDGEIVGTGIEISFDVTFTVHLLKGKIIGWPRGENDTEIFTAGNARPLDQCVEHATTEMVNWLQTDYSLDPRSIHILMGQVVEYDLGNFFDPAYTMICKMSKQTLKNLGVQRNP